MRRFSKLPTYRLYSTRTAAAGHMTQNSQAQEAQAVVTGVYAVANNTVYVTVRLIRAHDSLVISSFDYSLPRTENIASLLEMDSFLIH